MSQNMMQEKTAILFMTDGNASYPDQQVKKIKSAM
jgi:hypothetical protein